MDDNNDEFFFESSHLALRGNLDYLKVLKHLAVLCAKRIQVQGDIDLITAAQIKAQENPLQFVEQLKHGSLNLPLQIIIPEIPTVDFSKYNFDRDKHRNTPEPDEPSTSQEKLPGIAYWTLDEQRRLEELLNKFPPEAIESQRYAKIARAMGNRTPKQIASRVQKFFKKLHEANLPIPGSNSFKPTRRNNNRSQRQKFKLERPTTFFPERVIPPELLMKNDCDDNADEELPLPKSQCPKELEDIDQRILHFLKLVRAEKERIAAQSSSIVSGIECSCCNKSLLVGSRWWCNDCEGVSFCGDCLISQILNKSFVHLHHEVRQS